MWSAKEAIIWRETKLEITPTTQSSRFAGAAIGDDSTGCVILTVDAYARDGRRFTVLVTTDLLHFELRRQFIANLNLMSFWEIIWHNPKSADELGLRLALILARTIWIADAHRNDGKRFLCTPMRS